MITLIKQLLTIIKEFFGGATSASVNHLIGVTGDATNFSFLTGTTDIMGVAIPTFILYIVFLAD